jgi:hypothetical protein
VTANRLNDKKPKTHKKAKTWQLVVVFVLAAFASATLLRLNNIGMVQRRDAVLAADAVGDVDVTQSRLYDLQRYVSGHMNTDLGKGIYLEYSYKRDVQVAYAAVSVTKNPNGNIYKKVQDVCAPQFTSWSYAYIQCTTDELAKYPSSDYLNKSANIPRADMYLHSFVSPVWSPDFAGWSVLVCGLLLVLIIVRLLGKLILKLLLRRHHKTI